MVDIYDMILMYIYILQIVYITFKPIASKAFWEPLVDHYDKNKDN
jgi:hypothetical protein